MDRQAEPDIAVQPDSPNDHEAAYPPGTRFPQFVGRHHHSLSAPSLLYAPEYAGAQPWAPGSYLNDHAGTVVPYSMIAHDASPQSQQAAQTLSMMAAYEPSSGADRFRSPRDSLDLRPYSRDGSWTSAGSGRSSRAGSVSSLDWTSESQPTTPSPLLQPGRQSMAPTARGLADLQDSPGGPDSRPNYPYVTLIRLAILGSPKQRLTLSDIYAVLEDRFPYFKTAGKGWRNSVRHNLSLNKCFKKEARPRLDPGKGSYWRVDTEAEFATARVRPNKKPKAKPPPAVAAEESQQDDRAFLVSPPQSLPQSPVQTPWYQPGPRAAPVQTAWVPVSYAGIDLPAAARSGVPMTGDLLPLEESGPLPMPMPMPFASQPAYWSQQDFAAIGRPAAHDFSAHVPSLRRSFAASYAHPGDIQYLPLTRRTSLAPDGAVHLAPAE